MQRCFGYAEVDIEIPCWLWPKFEEMCPFFVNREVLEGTIPQSMLDYLHQTGRVQGSGKKLLDTLSAEKMLVYEPLLPWYLAHRAEIKAFPWTINYTTAKIFTWFVEQVTAVHRRCRQKQKR